MAIFGAMRQLVFVLVLLLSVFSISSRAQQGLPFTTNIELDRQFGHSRINSMVQDSEETMFYATSRGILKFDGSTWELIATPSPAVKVFLHTPSNRIFVGLKKGAIELQRTDSGTYSVAKIPGVVTDQSVSQITGSTQSVYFIGENEIHELDPSTQKTATKHSYPEKLISGGFVHKEVLFLFFYQEGLFRLIDGKLESKGNYAGLAEDQLVFNFESKEGTFLGFENDEVLIFNGTSFRPIARLLATYLAENILSDGILLNDSLMALSTLAGGAVIVNVNDQAIQYKFDYASGAKDNEIFCLGKDSDEGLWLAYESGLSRVDLSQPVKNFSGFPGIEGNLTSSLVSNNQLYVGTGTGVFVLKEARDKAEMDRMLKELIRKNQEAKADDKPVRVPQRKVASEETKDDSNELIERFKENPEEVKDELSKKELRELKREIRKQRKEDRKAKSSKDDSTDPGAPNNDSEEEIEREQEASPSEESEKSVVESKVQEVQKARKAQEIQTKPLNSIAAQNNDSGRSFLFRKIKGLDVKCKQLINVGNQVFAATNNGLYLIAGENSENLTPGLYINQVSTTQDGAKMLLATHSGIYEMVKSANGRWTSKSLNEKVQFAAYNVIQDSEGSIWAGTDNGAFRYYLDETKYYPIPEVLNERVLVTNVDGVVHFLLPSALFKYVPKSDTILPAILPEVPSSEQLEYLTGANGIVWIRSGLGWHVLNGKSYVGMLPYLDLFEDIRHLSTDEKGNVYVIDKGLHIYSVLNKGREKETKFKLYIRQVVDASGQPFSLQKMNIEANGNALIFNVSAPFYLKSQGTQYQYRIDGLRDYWSQWNDNPIIDPGHIPAGSYVLQVRAKNILGEMSEIQTLAFSVQRHILLRWYSLLGYFLVLALAVFGLIKYRERSLKETQRILEDKVIQRTADLAKAMKQAEELLLNILPKETAEELKLHGQATARHYNQVSVLFTDFQGFTAYAENTKPQELVNELHRCFVRFDEIIGKYGLEKIKTIGDAYMCAGGVPIKNNSNAIASTMAALEIRAFMTESAEKKQAENLPILPIRIGIHTGPLTAGVVGAKKFAYDIWGDTVNLASRMETASEANRVNISATTYELVKKYFECEVRGKKQVKGKGMIEMYFVNSIKPEFSEDGLGLKPNQRLLEIIG